MSAKLDSRRLIATLRTVSPQVDQQTHIDRSITVGFPGLDVHLTPGPTSRLAAVYTTRPAFNRLVESLAAEFGDDDTLTGYAKPRAPRPARRERSALEQPSDEDRRNDWLADLIYKS